MRERAKTRRRRWRRRTRFFRDPALERGTRLIRLDRRRCADERVERAAW